MPRKSYTPEKKESILKTAAEIGAAKAAKEAGVSYATVLKWMKETAQTTAETIQAIPGNAIQSLDEQIASTEAEIATLTEQLTAKKAELKELRRAREKAEKIEQQAREAEEKKELIEEVLKSGLSVDEIRALLKA